MLITTCQAENTVDITQRLAGYLSERLKRPVENRTAISSKARYLQLDQGRIDIGWICGLPYVKRAEASNPAIELLAAPVVQGNRYGERPIYFSDVVVRKESLFRQFTDLRGAIWAYNDKGSLSGYVALIAHVVQLGETGHFFGRMIRSGAHKHSLQMVLDKRVDAAAIDSTVLDWELHKRPFLSQYLRIISTIGPNPIPPLVIKKSVPQELKQSIRHLLLHMHEEENGRFILNQGQLARFVQVKDWDYNPIRKINQIAKKLQIF